MEPRASSRNHLRGKIWSWNRCSSGRWWGRRAAWRGGVGGCSFSFVGLTQGCFFSLCASFHPFTNSHFKQKVVEFIWCSSWQSDTRSTIVNYDSSIVHMTIKFPTVVIYNRKAFIRLATDHPISLADVRSVFAEQRRTLLNKKECFVLTTISKL